jgi:hypothetical protein
MELSCVTTFKMKFETLSLLEFWIHIEKALEKSQLSIVAVK